MSIAGVNSASVRSFAILIGVVATLPGAALLVSLVVFPLLFAVEALVIGAYPFLATFRSPDTGTVSSFVFPINWLLTALQWSLIGMAFARKCKAYSVGEQVIFSCGIWIGTNLMVRLVLFLLGIGIVTAQVRM